MNTGSTSMRLDEETMRILKLLEDYHGGNKTTIIKHAIRELARKEGLIPRATEEKELQKV